SQNLLVLAALGGAAAKSGQKNDLEGLTALQTSQRKRIGLESLITLHTSQPNRRSLPMDRMSRMDRNMNPQHGTRMERVLYEVKKVIVGQDHLLERLIVALLARGHILVEGVPGLAKTMAIKTLAEAIGGEFKRIQFTPDLVPADLVGTRIYNQK